MTSRIKKPPHLVKIIGICLMIVFILVIVELAAVVVTTNDWVLKSTSQLSSTRWYLLWLNQMSRKEIKDVTNYSIDEHHPYLGWSPKKNSRTTLHNNAVVSFNSAGIRGVREYRLEKTPNVQRIAVIGDSFTFGEDLNDAETYSAQLEKKLANTEVMNFAVHGYGLDQMLLRFEQKALAYNPDVVVFAFIYDDISRSFLRFRDYQKPVFELTNTGELTLTNTPIPKPDQLLNQKLLQPKTLLAAQLLYERWQLRAFNSSAHDAFAQAVFSRVYQQALSHNVTPVFLFLPSGSEMTDLQSNLLGGEIILFDFCQKTTAVCLSARPYLLDAYKQGARYDINRHYSANTNAIIAEGLLKDLRKNTVVTDAD